MVIHMTALVFWLRTGNIAVRVMPEPAVSDSVSRSLLFLKMGRTRETSCGALIEF